MDVDVGMGVDVGVDVDAGVDASAGAGASAGVLAEAVRRHQAEGAAPNKFTQCLTRVMF